MFALKLKFILLPQLIATLNNYACSLPPLANVDWSRVESGSDDPDYLGHLGHFFGGSSGSHPQTKLSGCDPNF